MLWRVRWKLSPPPRRSPISAKMPCLLGQPRCVLMERDLERQPSAPESASTPTANAPLPSSSCLPSGLFVERQVQALSMHSESASLVSVLGAFGVIRVQPHCVDGIFPESSPSRDNFFFGTQNHAARVRADGAFSSLGCALCFFFEGGDVNCLCSWFDTAFATGYTQEHFLSRTVISCVWQIAPMATRHVRGCGCCTRGESVA